jgi:hypothetical protein
MPCLIWPSVQYEADPSPVHSSDDISVFHSEILSVADHHFVKAEIFAYKSLLPELGEDVRARYEQIVASHREKALALVEAAKVADEIEEIARRVRTDLNRVAPNVSLP